MDSYERDWLMDKVRQGDARMYKLESYVNRLTYRIDFLTTRVDELEYELKKKEKEDGDR